MIFEILGGLIGILADGYGKSRKRNQEKLGHMCDEAYQADQYKLKDLESYNSKTDGKFISIIEGCE